MRFSGTITQKVDGKGRVSIPADFRRALEAGDPEFTPEGKRVKMRVVYGDPSRKCLEIYTLQGYNKLLDRIAQLPEGDDDRELLELVYVAGSEVVEVDGDGRTILPQRMRDHAGLPRDGGDAVFAGALDVFRVWSAEEYEAEKQRMFERARARMTGGNILKLLPQAKD